MFWFLFIIGMGVLGRLAGNGFGAKWGVSFLPELLHSLPYGIALGWACNELGGGFVLSLALAAIGSVISYAGMQSATWMFLRWESHDDPNTDRSSTLKPIVDFIAEKRGFKLGDEGYAWIAAGVKGFIIGTPVGGVLTALFWALGYEAGSHAKGRVERFGIDPHMFSEFFSGAFGGFTIFLFVKFVELFG